nr:uncharacterized protein LOC129283083 [Lytechinus pictus]XP_054774896.1 uncharacterized protein LOC129283083 [Lytechinus pictus]XP_054774897.1 uncharacterized protein LOC129283083 [Lytechinus pictus]
MPSAGAVCVPTITPLRVPFTGQTSSQIDTNTLIEIKSATRNASVYFSTNGSKPDPFVRKDKNTIKYKGPFLLNPGKRTIKAIAVSGDGQRESHVNSKTFIVDWVSPDNDENQEDDDQSFIMDSRRPQRSLHNSLNNSGHLETIQTNGSMALARSSMPMQNSMPHNGWVGPTPQPQTTLNQNPDYLFHYHMHQTSPRQNSLRQSVGSGPAMVQPPVVVDAMSGYNNQDAWRPLSVPLPAVLNQSISTQTVGLFYPTHEQATRSAQDVEAVRQVREQISTGTGTGPAQEKPRLTDISPGKGYWKRQIAHIAAHLEAFSQKDAEFRAGVGKPKMGKITYASVEDDGVDVTLTISLESRGSNPPVRGNRAQVARQDAINAKSKNESDSPYGATTRKKKPLTKRLAAKKKVEEDRLTPEEKQLIRELGPRGDGNTDVVQDMLDEGADPNCETKDGIPAIVYATMNNQVDSIPVLADAGAEMNRKTPARKGNTALHEAVLLGPDGQEAIEALLDSGANPKVQNNKGDTPYDLAVGNGYSSIVALFTSSMGQDMLNKMTKSKKDKGKKGRRKETESEDESEEEEKPRRKSKKYKEKLPKDKGTVVPVSKFNPENDAEKLRKAMKGLGTDEQAIIDVLANRSNDQRQKIARQFKQMFGKDLLKELKSELSGKLLDVVQGLMMTPAQYDAYQLNKAVKGLGTNEEILIEILCTRTNSSIEAIKTVYEDAYGEELEEAIADDTSGHFERLLVSVLQGSRPEGDEVDPDKAKADAEALYKAGEAKWGTDESRFNVIMMSRSYAQLRATFEEYGKLGKHDIEQSIKREMSGDLKDAMLTVVRCVRNKHKYFSDKLYKTMKGAGTDDDTLKRIVISRAEVDMLNIKGEFQSAYQQSLGQFIADDTSGDYKKILLALVGGTN